MLKGFASLRRGNGGFAYRFCAGLLAISAAALLGEGPAEARVPTGYAVVDAFSGEPLVGVREDRRMHPASLTKMMTLYLVFEAIKDKTFTFDDLVETSVAAHRQPPSHIGLAVGDTLTVRDAVRAAAVFSANDAAVALAEMVAGSEQAFAERMTAKARAMGMANTTFKNATGLTAVGHLSTPADMAILARRLIQDFPANAIVFDRKSTTVKGQRRNATNKLLRVRDGVDGVKTGYTKAAGFNLAATEKRGDRRVIVSYFGGETARQRDIKVLRLLDLGFERLEKLIAPLAAPTPTRNPARRAPIGAEVMAFGAYSTLEVSSVPAEAREQVDEWGAGRRPDRATLYAPRPQPAPRSIPSSRAPATPRALAADGWSVQVGAYARPSMAVDQLNAVASLRAPALAAAEARVTVTEAQRTYYRARFSGLDRRAAAAACAWLAQRRVDCAAVPPRGWES